VSVSNPDSLQVPSPEDHMPQDIDIVVLDGGLAPERIKSHLVSVNPSFFLVPSTNPRNTYKVLWYNLSAASSYLRASHACKVDILVPGRSQLILGVGVPFSNDYI
jgi:hypothetical protein